MGGPSRSPTVPKQNTEFCTGMEEIEESWHYLCQSQCFHSLPRIEQLCGREEAREMELSMVLGSELLVTSGSKPYTAGRQPLEAQQFTSYGLGDLSSQGSSGNGVCSLLQRVGPLATMPFTVYTPSASTFQQVHIRHYSSTQPPLMAGSQSDTVAGCLQAP